MFGGWACDGDDHWTVELIREWWADRDRLVEWIDRDLRVWSAAAEVQGDDGQLGGYSDACNGRVEYSAYIAGSLHDDLRAYGFWVAEGARPGVSICFRRSDANALKM